jgi:hypothetical protein
MNSKESTYVSFSRFFWVQFTKQNFTTCTDMILRSLCSSSWRTVGSRRTYTICKRKSTFPFARSNKGSSQQHSYSSQASSLDTSHPAPVPLKQLSASWLNGESSYYIEELYERWKENPNSVHSSWNEFFTKITSGVSPEEAYPLPVTLIFLFSFL